MRRIEEANKFELARSIKALVARALADEMIEGGMSAYGCQLNRSTRRKPEFRPSAQVLSAARTETGL
jgi:hypothetical protein